MSIDIQNIDLSKMKKWTPESILKKKRIESGFTQKQVADILGISLRQWQRYEKDDDLSCVTFQMGINICELLNIDVYTYVTPLNDILEHNLVTPGEVEESTRKEIINASKGDMWAWMIFDSIMQGQ